MPGFWQQEHVDEKSITFWWWWYDNNGKEDEDADDDDMDNLLNHSLLLPPTLGLALDKRASPRTTYLHLRGWKWSHLARLQFSKGWFHHLISRTRRFRSQPSHICGNQLTPKKDSPSSPWWHNLAKDHFVIVLTYKSWPGNFDRAVAQQTRRRTRDRLLLKSTLGPHLLERGLVGRGGH